MSCWCFIVNCIEYFYVNDEPESKFLYIETIKLYCIALYCILKKREWRRMPDREKITSQACSINTFATELLFLFKRELLRGSYAGLLFTNQEQKRISCHKCETCSWRHKLWSKWQRSRPFFFVFVFCNAVSGLRSDRGVGCVCGRGGGSIIIYYSTLINRTRAAFSFEVPFKRLIKRGRWVDCLSWPLLPRPHGMCRCSGFRWYHW